MTTSQGRLLLQAAPFLRRGISTPRLMTEVIIGMGPVVLAACYFFGLSAIFIMLASVAGAMSAEWLFNSARPRGSSWRDGSAILTGIVLALCLPPAIPLWMACMGGFVGVALGKAAFGGLGQNMFNPALVGRAFLQAAFPGSLTTWSAQGNAGSFFSIRPSNFALPFMHPGADAVTSATPLGLMKFEHQHTDFLNLLFGNTAGSLGETCAIIILICGVIMALRRAFDWRIPASILLTVAVLSTVFWAMDSGRYPPPWFMLASGGLLFGAVYMATDPVTSPITPKGAVIFGIGIGAIVVLIRLWGGLPEGVMYAILLGNAVSPMIDNITQPRVYGTKKKAEAKA